MGYACHLLTCTQVKHYLLEVCKSVWGEGLNMVFCFVELAWEILIVMFTIHNNFASDPMEYYDFTMGVQASSMCYMKQPLYVKLLKWPKRRLLHI